MGEYKSHFLGLEDQHYLYTGAESPSLKINSEALETYLQNKSLGEEGRRRMFEVEQALLENLAKLLNAKTSEISITGNASEALNNIVHAYPFKKGANVILNDLEYPSVFYPFLSLQNEGHIQIKMAKHQNGVISVDSILNLIDDNTEMVALSHVSYMNGYHHDLKKLYIELRNKNIPLLVDATQSLGVVEVNSDYFDFLVCSSYKWLLGAHGIGITYISEKYVPVLKQVRIGWRNIEQIFFNERFESYELRKDAKIFELGFNNYPAIYTLKNSTDLLLDIGIKEIEQHVINLGGQLIEQLKVNGYQLFTPEEASMRSGNIAIHLEDAASYMDKLEQLGIKVWGGDGRLRVSINFYNNEEDIHQLLVHLNELYKGE